MSVGTQRRLAAIVSADVVGYSRLMGVDEVGTLAALRAHRAELIDPKITQHGGRIVKTMGDGLLLEFASVVNAAQCSIELQQAMAERNKGVDEERRITFRIGVNLGDIIIEGDDIFGDGVNIAARLQEIAKPGGVAISRRVHEDVRDRLEEDFQGGSEHQLKNIARPVQVWHWLPGSSGVDIATAAEALALPDRPSIAVLPFDNMSGDPEQEYFADGITEDIITSLSKLSGLLVIARNSSFVYKGRAMNVQEIARELNVRHVLEGSVRRSGERVRITAQLIDRESGGHMWAERYDRELTDIFAVQDEVTQEIVSALAVQLTREEQDRPAPSGTDNAEAYDYFLRGREQYWLHTREGLTQARQLLRRAIELDPEFAPSYAFLSHSCIQVHINRWHGDGENPLDQALDYARLAVRFDEHYPKSRSSLGNAYMWRREHDLAIEEIHIALTLDPNFASALMELGRLYHYTGRSAEAIDLIERSMRLDPHYPDLYLHSLAQAHFHTGNYDQAVELLKRRLVRKPDTDISRVLLASSYGHLGRIPEAREMWAEALKVNPDYSLAQRRQVLPYKDPADFDLITDGLAKAGISQ